eukprot:TRINITY_DN3840_c0_g1_i1.p1 TRINITY_DN3840_c0_g1~~TRINITY_DN3840_c0_g1_i1.p1  ORF type:complete len:1402 (-),score=292.52 TRINITY_DN3840_c0_g1_i1:28-4233(-)
MPYPKHQHLPYLPTVASPTRGTGIPDRSIARWRSGDLDTVFQPAERDHPKTPRGVKQAKPDGVPSLAQKLREANGTSSMPTLPRLSPRTLQRQTSAHVMSKASEVDIWRDAGEVLLRKNEAKLPMLVPPPAHRVLGFGHEAVSTSTKKFEAPQRTKTLQEEHVRSEHEATPKMKKAREGKSPSRSRKKPELTSLQPQSKQGDRHAQGRASVVLGLKELAFSPGLDEKKKSSQASALALDREFVESQLAEQEDPEAQRERDEAVVDSWWGVLFSPLPAPRQMLPRALADQPGLVPMSNGKTLATKSSVKSRARQQVLRDFDRVPAVEFSADETEDLVKLCRAYAKLTQPPVPSEVNTLGLSSTTAGRPWSDRMPPLVLSRPSFCHMLIALRGLAVPDQSHLCKGRVMPRPRFHWAVKLFDTQAVPVKMKGFSPSGTMIGMQMPLYRERKENGTVDTDLLNDRRTVALTRLFAELVKDMAVDPAWAGQALTESLIGSRVHLITRLLPPAEAHAKSRMKLLRFKGEELLRPEREAAEAARLEAEAAAEAQRLAEGKKKRRGHRTSPGRSPTGADRMTPLQASSPHGASKTPLALPTRNRDASPSASTTQVLIAATAEEPTSPFNLEEEEDPANEEPLLAEVAKAELLTSNLLEPEVAPFVAMFLGIFQVLFETYCDTPSRSGRGHMSIIAFLRFCFDFGLFPKAIDIQTVQRLYNMCSAPEPELPGAAESARVEYPPSSPALSSCGGTPSNRNLGKRRRLKRHGGRTRLPEEKEVFFFWEGLQIPQRFEWLTKQLVDLEPKEAMCVSILTALDDWMKDRLLKLADLFHFLDADGHGSLSCQKMRQGVTLLGFENLPPDDEVEECMRLIMPSSGEIDFEELGKAIAVVCKQRYKLELANNFFLKAEHEMCLDEQKASAFIRDLHKVMEMKKMGASELFDEFKLKTEEPTHQALVEKAHLHLRLTLGRCPGLDHADPLGLLDTNGDGIVTREEFVFVMRMMAKAQAVQGGDASGRQKRQLQAATTALTELQRAWQETLSGPKKELQTIKEELQEGFSERSIGSEGHRRHSPQRGGLQSPQAASHVEENLAKRTLKDWGAVLREPDYHLPGGGWGPGPPPLKGAGQLSRQSSTSKLSSRGSSPSSHQAKRDAEASKKDTEIAAGKFPFGLQHFIECLLLVAFEAVGFRGTPTQADQPTLTKVLWLLIFLRWQFEEKFNEEAAQKQVEKAYFESAQKRRKKFPGEEETKDASELAEPASRCVYLPPLKKLLRDSSDLFKDVPHAKSDLEFKGVLFDSPIPDSQEEPLPCPVCGKHRYSGWGCLSCEHCSSADDFFEACLRAKEEAEAASQQKESHRRRRDYMMQPDGERKPADAKRVSLIKTVLDTCKTPSMETSVIPGAPSSLTLDL